MHVAVVDRSLRQWAAGTIFTEMIVRALRLAGGERLKITVLGEEETDRWRGLADFAAVPKRVVWEDRARHLVRMRSATERFCDSHRVSALLLYDDPRPGTARYTRVTWIPDFQHRYLAQYFQPHEVALRDRALRRFASHADIVLLSSQSVYDDFKRFIPQYAQKGRILRFPSIYALTPPAAETGFARMEYQLPHSFALVANQFWAHKNHQIVVKAAGLLAARGIRIPIVMTGLPADYRDPANTTVSTLLQTIARDGVSGQVIPLGLVPRPHLTDLLRTATVVIQPSRFEGWNTGLQDALALGRPVICSDIPVHREQALDALGFFGCDDPEALAAILERTWPELRPGPDPSMEGASLERHAALAHRYGQGLLDLCGRAGQG